METKIFLETVQFSPGDSSVHGHFSLCRIQFSLRGGKDHPSGEEARQIQVSVHKLAQGILQDRSLVHQDQDQDA